MLGVRDGCVIQLPPSAFPLPPIAQALSPVCQVLQQLLDTVEAAIDGIQPALDAESPRPGVRAGPVVPVSDLLGKLPVLEFQRLPVPDPGQNDI